MRNDNYIASPMSPRKMYDSSFTVAWTCPHWYNRIIETKRQSEKTQLLFLSNKTNKMSECGQIQTDCILSSGNIIQIRMNFHWSLLSNHTIHVKLITAKQFLLKI